MFVWEVFGFEPESAHGGRKTFFSGVLNTGFRHAVDSGSVFMNDEG